MSQQTALTLGPDRFLRGIVAGAVLLIVVSVGLVLVLRQAPPPPPADPSSPTGVVQAFVAAVRAGDAAGARGYLTREARTKAESQRWPPSTSSADDNVRIIVTSASENGDTATVRLSITRYYAGAGPFSNGTSHNDRTIRLVREDGAWRISDPVDAYILT